MPTPVSQKLKWAGVKNPHQSRTGPLWKGPEEDGITFSLLSRFLVCRERFRLLVVEGLKPQDQFNHRLEYGQMWHACEEALAAGYPWERALATYVKGLGQRYRTAGDHITKWHLVCKAQFPLYVEYWKSHPDVETRKPLLQEQTFAVPYQLPTRRRRVTLKGKWDSVDLIGRGKATGIYLQENKTKGDPNEQQIKRQLTFDLQTMMYLVALQRQQELSAGDRWSYPILGVRYNVIRRPLSGGRGTIVQGKGTQGSKCTKCKGVGFIGFHPCEKCGRTGRVGAKPPETDEEYLTRLAQYIKDEPGNYFMRWKVEIGKEDLERFKRETLDPILEQLCDWWKWMSQEGDERNLFAFGKHWRHPFGVYNVLDEGGSSDLDEYLLTGSEAGLERTNNLFPELS